MSKIFVLGSVNTDIVVNADCFPKPGETIRGTSLMINAGGKGANQAVAVQKLGGDLRFCGCIGDDIFGRRLIDTLHKYGVETSHIAVLPNVVSGVALITVANGENSIVIHAGANNALDVPMAKSFLDIAEQGDILLVQLEIVPKTVMVAMAYAKEIGMAVVLNPAPAEYFREDMLRYVDYLIPNENELFAISGKNTVDDAVGGFRKYGIDIIVTLGEKGCAYNAAEGMRFFQAEKVRAIDSTAAGDTFCGAFAVGLSRGNNVEQAIVFAQKAAALSVTRRGALQSIPTIEEID